MCSSDVTEYGAVGDGRTVDTEAIQSAIDDCADAGGGTVVVPAGEYLVTPLFLRSDINLHLEPGAVLQASDEITDFPVIDGRFEGIERETYASLLTGRDLENVSVTGQGTLDGAGAVWWEAFRHDVEVFNEHGLGREDRYPSPDEAILDHARPRTIDLLDCSEVLIRDVRIKNSPAWTINPTYCENVTIDNVHIENPEESENTDGINPSSCRNVRISNCYVDVGDDCITIKSGYDADGRRVGEPCENVAITNCTMARGHGGVVIGSEMSGDVRNVTVSNCVFDDTDNGLRIKTERGRGGVVENIRATNIVMNDLRRTAFIVTMYYHDGPIETASVDEGTPQVRNVHYSDIVVDDVDTVATFRGLPEMPIDDVHLSDVHVKSANTGVRGRNVDNLYFQNVSIDATETPAFDIERATDFEFDRITDPNPNPELPIVRLSDADGVIRDCRAPEGTGTFLERGASDKVTTVGNVLSRADEAFTVVDSE